MKKLSFSIIILLSVTFQACVYHKTPQSVDIDGRPISWLATDELLIIDRIDMKSGIWHYYRVTNLPKGWYSLGLNVYATVLPWPSDMNHVPGRYVMKIQDNTGKRICNESISFQKLFKEQRFHIEAVPSQQPLFLNASGLRGCIIDRAPIINSRSCDNNIIYSYEDTSEYWEILDLEYPSTHFYQKDTNPLYIAIKISGIIPSFLTTQADVALRKEY